MRESLQALLTLVNEGYITRFAIGGAIAASFYAPAVTTEDLDVFAFLKPSDSGLLILTPIYERMKALGGKIENEYVTFGNWPIQLLPAYTPLVEEAVLNAVERSYENLKVPVVDANYLCAIALQTGRSKDYQRVHSLIECGQVSADKLKMLIEKFMLQDRWQTYVRRYA